MKKKNLDAFMMSKAQMNDVNGGRIIKCRVLDLETLEEQDVELESGTNVDKAVEVLNEAYGDWAFITC